MDSALILTNVVSDPIFLKGKCNITVYKKDVEITLIYTSKFVILTSYNKKIDFRNSVKMGIKQLLREFLDDSNWNCEEITTIVCHYKNKTVTYKL